VLSPAGIASEVDDIHMSSPDVNMNYISLLFLDVEGELFSGVCLCVFLFIRTIYQKQMQLGRPNVT